MDTAILVRSDRQLGWELLDSLEKAEFPIEAAFWQYLSDAETWRLVLATPLYDQIGSNAAYTRLQEHINQMSADIQEEFSVLNISLISPTSERLKKMEQRYGQVEKNRSLIRRIDLSSAEAYVYFL